MLEELVQYFIFNLVIGVASALIIIFGGIIAMGAYLFILAHVLVYDVIKEVYNGLVSGNA